jgi:ornithine cyclodeaminase/alanine dehydrogenase-like protein (mu-crystallin family)
VGAGAGIAAKYLATEDASVLGVLGSGGQARTLADAVACSRKIAEMNSPTLAHRGSFAAWARARHGWTSEAVDRPSEVFKVSDIVIVATDSVKPVFDADWINNGTHLAYVNDDELDLRIFEKADLICAINPPSNGPGKGSSVPRVKSFPSWIIATDQEKQFLPKRRPTRSFQKKTVAIGDIIAGKKRGRESRKQITISKAGGGQRFVTVGAAIYHRVKEVGLGREIPTAWFLQNIRD